jgi:hypothetical protein
MTRFRTEIIGDATLYLGDCREFFDMAAQRLERMASLPLFEEPRPKPVQTDLLEGAK